MKTPVHLHVGLVLAAAAAWLVLRGPRARRAAIGAIGIATAASLLLHAYVSLHAARPFGFDLAIVHSALWNLVRGRGPVAEPLGDDLYALHAFFHLPLFLPFYLAFDHPAWLNVAHLLYGAAAAVPAYLLGRDVAGSREAGAALALLYLLLPATSGFLLVECQPSITGPVFLLAYLHARLTGRRRRALLLALPAAFAYEPFLLAVALDGLFEAARPGGDRRLGAAVLAGTAATAALFLLHRAGGAEYSGSRHYATLGGSPLGVARALVESPATVASLVLTPRKVGFLLHQLLPFLGLPLLAPGLLLLAAPEVALVLLSDPGSDMPRIDAFYTHVSTSVLVAGAAVGLRRLAARGLDAARGAFLLLLAAFALQFAYPHTVVPRAAANLRAAAEIEPGAFFETVPFSIVPEGASVLVPAREDVVRFPRRRAVTPDDFLSPRIHAAHAAGRLETAYVARPAGALPPPGGWKRIAGPVAGLEIYRRREADGR